MKKITVCLLALSMILSHVSCGMGRPQSAAPTDSKVSDTSAIAPSAELSAPPDGNYSTMGNLADDSPVIDGAYTAPVTYEAAEGNYYLHDQKRRFRVGTFNGKTSDKSEDNFKNVYSSGNSIFGDTKEEADLELYKGFYLMNEIGKIRDYFYKNFGIDTQGHTLFIGYNDGKDNGRNAYGGAAEDKTYSSISVGKNVSFPCCDILAHEYTHTIQYMHHFVSDADEKGTEIKMDEETVTISEGLADVFACFYTGKWDLDFTPLGNGAAHRNAANPSGNHKSNIQDKVESNQKEYGYNYATCISHAAYLMSESGEFSKEALQSLWFDAMCSLTAHCKYADLRDGMEKAAIRAKMTNKQKQAIADAFDAVGISHFDKAAKYSGDIKLEVYDLGNNIYDDYKVEIYRLNKVSDKNSDDETYNYSTALARSQIQKKPEPLQLHLDKGTYRILVSDNSSSQNIKSFTITVDPSVGSKTMLVREFGAAYTVAPGAKLTVLDADDNVLEDYKAIASGDDGYSKQIADSLNLPVKNYYTVTLSHTENGSAVMNFFTVRIKKGAADAMTFKSTFKGGSGQTGDSAGSDDSQEKSEDSSTPPGTPENDEGGTTPSGTNANDDQSDGQSSESPYADIVRKYESKYGKLTFNNVDGSNYYTGVFLIKLIDLNKDGVDELLIGYSTELEGYQQYITVPKLDVWTMVDSNPVRSYEGAIVHHGDIGSHCAYIDMDGQYLLINGYSGYDTDLHLLMLNNGEFQDYYTLVNDGNGSCKINDKDVDESEWVEMYKNIDKDAIKYHGVITESGQETVDSLLEDLEQGYAAVGM